MYLRFWTKFKYWSLLERNNWLYLRKNSYLFSPGRVHLNLCSDLLIFFWPNCYLFYFSLAKSTWGYVSAYKRKRQVISTLKAKWTIDWVINGKLPKKNDALKNQQNFYGRKLENWKRALQHIKWVYWKFKPQTQWLRPSGVFRETL